MVEEIWRTFGKDNLYRISNHGRIQTRFDFKTKKIGDQWYDKALKKSKSDKNGGWYLTFSEGPRHVRVHIKMWEIWKGPRKKGFVINHIDGDRSNCAIWNLEEVTQKENIKNLIDRGNFKGFRRENGTTSEVGIRTGDYQDAIQTQTSDCMETAL